MVITHTWTRFERKYLKISSKTQLFIVGLQVLRKYKLSLTHTGQTGVDFYYNFEGMKMCTIRISLPAIAPFARSLRNAKLQKQNKTRRKFHLISRHKPMEFPLDNVNSEESTFDDYRCRKLKTKTASITMISLSRARLYILISYVGS